HGRVEVPARRGYGIGDVDEGLRRLANRTRCNDFVLQRVNCGYFVFVLKTDIDSRAVPGRPDAVRQLARWNGRDLREIIGLKHFNFVEPADRDIGEHTVRIARNIDVVGDWTGVEGLQERKRRLRVEYLSLAGVFEGKPDLFAVRRCGDVGTE